MAKRKRLTPAQPGGSDTETSVLDTKLETKAFGVARTVTRAPIAQVAGEASAAAALQELATEIKRAKDEGRMIQSLPVNHIQSDYLSRDRLVVEDAELQALMSSLSARGQQTPIEVVGLDQGRYGLISGWRRLSAMRRLLAETGEDRFATIQAVLRQPETAADAYIAMIEENEIRVGLSYYERARAAAKAVEQGVFETDKKALLALFSTASRAKRSKIRSFLTLYHALDGDLKFAAAIPERLGLNLVKLLSASPDRVAVFQAALARAGAVTADGEISVLESVLANPDFDQSLNKAQESGKADEPHMAIRAENRVDLQMTDAGVSLTGPGVTDDFLRRLRVWLKQQS